MGIGTALTGLMTALPPELSLAEASQQMRAIAEDLRASLPIGYKVKGYAGQGGRTVTPWIGVFNPDLTEKPSEGLYVAYICHPDSAAATLTLQQGSEGIQKLVGAPEARRLLRLRADWVRSTIALEDDSLEPRAFGPGKRQPSYAAGSIASQTYRVGALPPEQLLAVELTSMLRILDTASSVLRAAYGPGWVKPRSFGSESPEDPQDLPRFVPKSSDNYVAEIASRSQVKTRLHEKVVNDLAGVATSLGWRASSEHPLDLVLRRSNDGTESTLIVEVKQVRGGNVVEAVRAAIGQLLMYRFQLFEASTRPAIGLVAAFSEDIGGDLRQLLSAELGIAVLWLDGRQWCGCDQAHKRALVSAVSIQ
jgi:hypothetical protein